MMHAFLALTRADIALYFGNRRALWVNIIAPIVIAAFFGYVFSPQQQKTPHVALAVVDLDNSVLSKAVVAALSADASLQVQISSEAEAGARVSEGKLSAAIVLPEQFGATAANALFVPRNKPVITLHVDPSKAMETALVRGLVTQHIMQTVSRAAFSGDHLGVDLVAGLRQNLRADGAALSPDTRDALSTLFDSVEQVQKQREPSAVGAGSSAGGLAMPFEFREAASITGPDKASYNGYAHAFAGMSVQFILFGGIDLGVGLLLARRLGLWKRLRAAPLSRTVLLGSRVVSGTLIAATLLSIIFAAAIAIFGVRIHGSVIGMICIGLSFSVMTASFGLLISAIGNSPEATRGLAIVATLIMVMLGGAWVPSFLFPEWLQTVSLVVPTRWAVDGMDATTWRGRGFDAAVMPTLVLLGFALVFAALALWRFDWNE